MQSNIRCYLNELEVQRDREREERLAPQGAPNEDVEEYVKGFNPHIRAV